MALQDGRHPGADPHPAGPGQDRRRGDEAVEVEAVLADPHRLVAGGLGLDGRPDRGVQRHQAAAEREAQRWPLHRRGIIRPMVDPRAALLGCAAGDGDLAEGALWLAAEECDGVEPGPWLRVLDELADEVRARCGTVPGGRAAALAVPVLAGLFRDRLRLRGATGADPRTHYLQEVLARGRGIPIACAAVWIAVGRRAGLPVDGIGLPGHFVVRVGETLVDAHGGGAVLSEERALALAQGPEVPVPAKFRQMTDLTNTMVRDSLDAFVKLDVEGMELEAIEGAAASFPRCIRCCSSNRSRPIKQSFAKS